MLRDLWQVTCSPFYIIHSNQKESFQYLFCKRHCPHYRGNRLSLRNRTSSTAWSQIWKEKTFYCSTWQNYSLQDIQATQNWPLKASVTFWQWCIAVPYVKGVHISSWLMQELDTHPFAGIQPPYRPCLHSSLSGEFLPLHPNILQVFCLFDETATLHLFPPRVPETAPGNLSHTSSIHIWKYNLRQLFK